MRSHGSLYAGLPRTLRRGAQHGLLALLLALTLANDLWAGCDDLLGRWLDLGFTEDAINQPFERLADLSRNAPSQVLTATEDVFLRASQAEMPNCMRELLGARTADEAQVIFTAAAGLSDEGKTALVRAAQFGEVEGKTSGESLSKLLRVQAQTLSNEGKSATLVSLKHLAENSVPGTEALLKKAAEEIAGANLGGVFEAQASEWIRANQATYGRLEQVAVDSTGGFNRIDTLSESYAFQMKSKFNAAGELALRDVDVEALIELVDQAQEAGNRIPALVSSNTVAQDLLDVCAARGIQVIRVDVVR